MELAFAGSYFLLVLVSSTGVLQGVAAYWGLKGLCFFRNNGLSYAVGVVLVVGAFLWFFIASPRNIEGHITGVQGFEQFALFSIAAIAATGSTALLASALHRQLGPPRNAAQRGLDVLQETTLLQALLGYLRRRANARES